MFDVVFLIDALVVMVWVTQKKPVKFCFNEPKDVLTKMFGCCGLTCRSMETKRVKQTNLGC